MDIKGILLVEKSALSRKLKLLNTELMSLPQGQIYFVRNGKNWRWRVRKKDENSRIVRVRLSKSERKYAAELSHRRYLEDNIARLEKRIHMIDQFFKDYPPLLCYPSDLEEPCTDFRDLLTQELHQETDMTDEWRKASYRTNPDRREQCVHKTKAGVMMRSKSEAMIADTLYDLDLPFHYEEEMVVSGIVIHPDFKLPRRDAPNEFMIWEHFGMMDNSSYFLKMLERLRLLHEAGYSFEKGNLICTFESLTHPLDLQTVQMMATLYC